MTWLIQACVSSFLSFPSFLPSTRRHHLWRGVSSPCKSSLPCVPTRVCSSPKMQEETGEKLRLVLKNPAQPNRDFPLELPSSSTVGDLKNELQRTYPGQPRPALQKLIFAGRILADEAQSLAQLFATGKVCRPPPPSALLLLSACSAFPQLMPFPLRSVTHKNPRQCTWCCLRPPSAHRPRAWPRPPRAERMYSPYAVPFLFSFQLWFCSPRTLLLVTPSHRT